jgi:hypothetical protein
MKKINLMIMCFLLFNSLLISQVKDIILFDDTFSELSESCSKLSLNGTDQGEVKSKNGSLIIDGSRSNYFGVYNNQALSGNFIVDLKFAEDRNVGFALISEKNGKPDLNNYTMLCVDTEDNNVIVEVRDCQNGKKNVLDYTRKTNFDFKLNEQRKKLNIGADLYKHVLTGKQYSVPFTETNKTIRIFRENNADLFHYYYQVSKEYNGQTYIGWMELRPSPDWTEPGSQFFVAILALHKGKAVFKNIKAVKKPVEDKDDTSTGFKVTRREYNWSGFFGDAYVVTFDNRFLFHDNDIKFVFWTEMNYIPAWHLSNQLLYTYEFVETWDKNVPGCHEPMSDRLRLWTRVEVLEDNPVRKVLKWHYVLANPNYEVPAEGKGKQLPEVDEYWTFYPDGSGTRRIIYTPKLDTDFRAPHELGELISVAGSKSNSSDFYDSPALSIMNLNGEIKQAHPGPKFDYYSEIDNWKQQILAVHFKNYPDVFCAWSTDPEIPQTFSGYPIRFENAWQNPNGTIVHWPVNKRPYTSAYSSGGTWKGEVSHACLLSWGVRDGIDWADNFKLDERERKYREWVSLIGLNKKDNNQELINKTSTWLFKGEVKTKGENVKFIAKDYKDNSFLFRLGKDTKEFDIRIIPEEGNTTIINPVIKIRGWDSEDDLKIFLNSREIDKNNFRKTYTDNYLYIWLGINLGSNNIIELKRNL